MYISELKILNFRQFGNTNPIFSVRFREGVTALVGENDTGKTAVIDAIRYVLSTRDMEFMKVQPDDFHIDVHGQQAAEMTICCKLSNLSNEDKGAFVEYLTYEGEDVCLYIHWSARRLNDRPGSRRWVEYSVRSGPDGKGPILEMQIRQLLAAAYLRPLRDAEREMSPGRASRLSQILANYPEMVSGTSFSHAAPPTEVVQLTQLSLVGLTDYLRYLVDRHPGIGGAQTTINKDYLSSLHLSGEHLHGRISFAEAGNEESRLRQILEKLELMLLEGPTGKPRGSFGLGSNNLLFMACELLLLGKEPDGFPVLLIEEPEAHLHPQRQLRLMEFLRLAAKQPGESRRAVQVIVTTHSPNLASKIPLDNLILLHRQKAFSLADGETQLSKSDYRFLERFLDVTKANLFFARGVIIVEGDAEAILIPVIAALVGKDLTQFGVSIVNVGGTGLRRYARVLQRKTPAEGELSIPVSCITDMDVVPDCAPQALGWVADDNDPKWTSPKRRWKAEKHFGTNDTERAAELARRRATLRQGDGQSIRTFVSDRWTLEYDLAFAGLAKDVFLAATLAVNDDPLNEAKKSRADVEATATTAFAALEATAGTNLALLCSNIYATFTSGGASKAIAAQYLAEILTDRAKEGQVTQDSLLALLPTYLKDAIAFVTSPFQTTAAGTPPVAN